MGILGRGPHADVAQTRRAMVFIDGTNLFYRLETAKIKLLSLFALLRSIEPYREFVRVYLYTTKPHFEKALSVHGQALCEGVRVVFGDALPTGDGNFKEKGVDALLVADLVFHAANKHYDYGIVISTDQDFARALTRVEDFGCRTAVVCVCGTAPALLKEAADEVFELNAEQIVANSWGEKHLTNTSRQLL